MRSMEATRTIAPGSGAVQETIKAASPASSSTTLLASPNPGTAGQPVTFSATVTGAGHDTERNRDLPEWQRCAGNRKFERHRVVATLHNICLGHRELHGHCAIWRRMRSYSSSASGAVQETINSTSACHPAATTLDCITEPWDRRPASHLHRDGDWSWAHTERNRDLPEWQRCAGNRKFERHG